MNLSDLLAKVSVATRATIDIDVDVFETLGAEVTRSHGRLRFAIRNVPWLDYDTSHWMSVGHLSASVDAAIDLAERILPGRYWSIHKIGGDPDFYVADIADRPSFRGEGKTPALAALAAVLAAKIGEDINDE